MIEFQNRQMKLPDGTQVVVCRILGSIDGAVLPQFEEKLLGFIDEGIKYLILVFSQVKYINSSGMGILVKLADRCNAVGGEMTLVDVPEKLVALFNMLGLITLIQLAKNEEEAIKAFQKNKGNIAPIAEKKATPPEPDSKVIAKTIAENKAKASQTTDAGRPKTTSENMRAKTVSENTRPKTSTVGSMAAPPPKEQKSTGKDTKPITHATPPSSTQPAPKVFIVNCQQCKAKISLGSQLRVGTYCCPRCRAAFKVTEAKKIIFLQPSK